MTKDPGIIRSVAASGPSLPPPRPFAGGPVFALAAACLTVLLVLSARSGYFGDELYFVAAGQRPGWGYADQPPLLPLLAHAIDVVFPGSVLALRAPAALIAAVGIVLTALCARELGGGRRPQLLAAAAYPLSTQLLASGGLMATSSVDPVLWAAFTYLLLRWVRTRKANILLLAGVVTAVAMQVKYLLPAWELCVLLMAAFDGPREIFRAWQLWVGAAIAGVSALPELLWQQAHGWPMAEMTSVIAGEVASAGGRWAIVRDVVLHAGLVAGLFLAALGLWALVATSEFRSYRFLGWSIMVFAVLVVVAQGRFYYVAGLYPLCWAVGSVVTESLPRDRLWRWVVSWPSYALGVVFAIVTALPVVPDFPDNIVTEGSANWPRVVDTVANAYETIPSAQRATTAVLTQAYWQAAAVDVLGRSRALPVAYSASRGYWYFGPPPPSVRKLIFVGATDTELRALCGTPKLVAHIPDIFGFRYVNANVSVWTCDRNDIALSSVWPRMRNLS